MAEKQAPTRPLFSWLMVVLAVATAFLGACGGDDDGGDESSGGGVEEDISGEAWTDGDLERLINIEVDGFTLQNSNVTDFGNATVQYVEDDPAGPAALSAVVTFQACDPFVCFDLSAPLDDEQRSNVRSVLPPVHIDNPDLVEEIGSTELAGRTVLAAYFRSFVDQDDGQATANSYRAITHDGTNLVSILVTPDFTAAGGLAESAGELEERMVADDGATVAADILTALSAELD